MDASAGRPIQAGPFRQGAETLCDVLLAVTFTTALTGLTFTIGGFARGVQAPRIWFGAALLIVGAGLLFVWERAALKLSAIVPGN